MVLNTDLKVNEWLNLVYRAETTKSDHAKIILSPPFLSGNNDGSRFTNHFVHRGYWRPGGIDGEKKIRTARCRGRSQNK